MKKIFFFITLFIIAITSVKAQTVTLVKNSINDTYTYYYDKHLERERFLYANRYTFGDTTAYCLEMGKAIDSNIYTYSTSFDEANIHHAALEFIKIVMYYGYDYPGHNTDNYYMATQELIWNRLTNTSMSWIKDMNPENKIDIRTEKDNIMALFNTHFEKPSFDGKEIELTLGETLILEDTNNVLNRYVTDSENVIIEENKLIITEDFTGEEIVLTKANYTGRQYLLYTSGASQKMMSTGGIDNVTSSIKIKFTGGTLEINKLDSDTKTNIPQGEATLSGAVYTIYNESGEAIDTINTGAKNKLEDLPLGKYTIKETLPSKGYLLDNNIYTFEITPQNKDIKLTVYEEVIKRDVEIFKVFASDKTGELIPEPNIIFEVYDKNNNLVNTITTDKEGHAKVKLPYGTYIFKQANTTKGYYKVEDFKITVSEYDERSIYKLLSNSEIEAKVKIVKKDFDTKENIINSNIKFKIFSVKDNKYISLKVSYPENKVTEEFQVDKNGIFITPISLPYGTYILEEVPNDLDGYTHNKEKITFVIGDPSTFVKEDDELYIEIPFYNQRVKGTINITKYGEEIAYEDNTYQYNEIKLEGVVLNLYAKEDIYENNTLIYKKDQLIKELITDKNGTVSINNLPLGKYYIKEISTIGVHILDTNIYDIELQYIDENTKVVDTTLSIKNYLHKGKLTIIKYETNTNNPIPNTLIEICTKDNQVIYKGYTDKEGKIIIEDIPYGEYYLSEVEASTGYRLLEDKINFEIDKEEKEIKVYNERIKVPNTGLSLNKIDIFIIILSSLGIILTLLFPRNKVLVTLSVIILLLGLSHFIIKVYKKEIDKIKNNESIETYMNKETDITLEEKYQYSSILEIPSINLKRGILDITNKYNNAKYNIELIKEDNNTIVLASHNGNNYNSYFGNLKNIDLGDEIKYYKDGTLYTYIYSEKYDINKNGYADIYKKDDIKSIILITCKDNDDNAQTVYIGYLKEESIY